MASRGHNQLDINDQRQRLRKLEREIQNELAELNRGNQLLNKRQRSPQIQTPNKILGPFKRSQTPQPYTSHMRTPTEKTHMYDYANQNMDEMDLDQSNLARKYDPSKGIGNKSALNASKEHLNNIVQQLEEYENSYDDNFDVANYNQANQKTPVRRQANRDRQYIDHTEDRSDSPEKSTDRARVPHKLQKILEEPVFDQEDVDFLKKYGKSFDQRVTYNPNEQETAFIGEERSPLKQMSRSPSRPTRSGRRTEEISVFGRKAKPEASMLRTDNAADTSNYFKPKISQKSREIAARMGDPLDRLISGHLPSKYRNKEIKKPSFRPQINRISEALDEHFRNAIFNGDELYRWDQLYLMRDKYKIERELKRIEHEKEQLANNQCTFSPKILSSLPGYDNQRSKKADVVHRSYQWAKQKEQRLQKDREEKLQRDLDECTFQPDLEKERAKMNLPIPRSDANIHERPFLVQGLEDHFERIDKAKRIKQQKQAVQSKYEGQNWENRKTKAEAPYLGRKSDLKRQVSISPVKKLTGYKYSRSPKKNNAVHNKENMGSIFLDMSRSAFIDDVEDEEKFTDAIAELHEELHKIDINDF